ncbi:MAG: S8 family serine peptidase [Chitinophagales bacterium]|nr:S8 family serine peptidase [Bacteroidota bacterium]MCB9044391.1 S8 family serine peptidase [Chitinophagales bacterium]
MQSPFLPLLGLIILCQFNFFNTNAQTFEPAFRAGQVLVQVQEEEDIFTIIKDFANKSQPIHFYIISEVSQPMHVWQLGFDEQKNTEQTVLQQLWRNTLVQNAQLNHLISYRSTIPNDSQFNQQWQYVNNDDIDLDIDLAWDVTTGGITPLGDTIVVCVVDDGINLNHPDIKANLWKNYAEIPNNGIDDDNNGYIDDYRGWNAYDDNDDVGSGFGVGFHGTPVAGIVGARGDNGIGVSGISWQVKLMIVEGGGDEAAAIAAYTYPLIMRKKYNESGGKDGAFVVATNSSWGIDFGKPQTAPLWCAMYDSLGMQGIVSAGATANANVNVDTQGDLPTGCGSDYLIAVTNIGENDVKITQAGYGINSVDLGAFGENTYTVSYNNYGGFGGTSGATPHVAGTVGLLYAAPCLGFATFSKQNPAEAALLIKQYILDGVEPNASLQGITVTGGRLNINNSMQLIMAGECNLAPIAQFEASETNLCPGETIQFTDMSTNLPNSWFWTFYGGNPGFSTEQNPSVTYDTEGVFNVKLSVTNDIGENTFFHLDYISVATPSGINAPVVEDFTEQSDWTIENPDNDITWTFSSNACNGKSALINNFSNQNIPSKDALVLNVDLRYLETAELNFDWAYTPTTDTSDSLSVVISMCNDDTVLWAAGGDDLATAAPTDQAFTPNACSEWESVTLNLDDYVGEVLSIHFINTNMGGNYLFLDNISVVGNITGVENVSPSADVSLFPNPSGGKLYITANNAWTGNANVQLFDIQGKILLNTTIAEQSTLDLSAYEKGVYFVKITSNRFSTLQKIVLQ